MPNKNLYKIIFIILIVIILLVCVYVISSLPIQNGNNLTTTQNQLISGNKNSVATIGGTQINVEIVTSSQSIAKGLGYRKSLDQDSGMLFLYDNYVTPNYWMKGMEFPLDIIWIRDNRVVGYEQNVPVSTSGTLPIYKPLEPINAVLEVNAGFVDANGIRVGDRVISGSFN